MKKTFPGSADSGKVPGKIFTIAVGTVFNRRRYRMGHTATILGPILLVLTGIGTIAGGNFVSYLCIKNPQNEEYTVYVQCFADF
jgi:hypothetical protein